MTTKQQILEEWDKNCVGAWYVPSEGIDEDDAKDWLSQSLDRIEAETIARVKEIIERKKVVYFDDIAVYDDILSSLDTLTLNEKL